MINCNPETVSTDFNVSDKLYFEPVFWEHVYDIIKHEKPEQVIVQLGGQTALKLAEKLDRYGIRIAGTSYLSLDIAEDRGSVFDVVEGIWTFLILSLGSRRMPTTLCVSSKRSAILHWCVRAMFWAAKACGL
jgi:hypothetical protein